MLKNHRLHRKALPSSSPLCEMLEGRLFLTANDVVATLSNGVLTITDSPAEDTFTVDGGGLQSDHKITITAKSGTSTTINGQQSWTTPTPVTGAIKILVGHASDSVTVQNLTALKSLSVTQAGEDSLDLNMEGCDIKGGLTFTGNAEYHTVSWVHCTFEGAVLADVTDGYGTFYANGSQFKKSLTVQGSAGNDTVDLRSCQVAGKLSLSLGDGPNFFDIKTPGTASSYADVIYAGGSGVDNISLTTVTPISGQAKFDLGAGDDIFSIFEVTAKTLTVNAGEGANDITMEDASFSGATTLTSGDGDDQFTFTSVGFNGAATLNGRGGSANVGNKFNVTGCHYNKSLTIQGSQGLDTLTFTSCKVEGALSASLGDGGSDFTFQKGSATGWIGGDFSYKAGEGPDSVTVTDSTIVGQAKIDTGLGSDGGDHLITFTRATLRKNLQCTSLEGNGTISVAASTVQGNVVVSGADGQEELRLDTSSEIKGNASVTESTDVAILTLYGGGGTIDGNASVNGFGGATLHMSQGSTLGCEIKGAAAVTSKLGAATVTINAGTIDGKFAIQGGTDGTMISISGPAVFKKDFSITGAGGRNDITLAGATFSGKANIKTGPGRDLLTVDDATFSGKASFDLGAGYDIVNVETTTTTAGAKTTFTGGLDLLGGTGEDTIVMGVAADAKRQVVFSGPSTLDGGLDQDRCTNGNTTGSPVLKNFE